MSRSLGGRSLTTCPSIRTSPEVIDSRPAIIRSAVVFPQPDGPTKTTNSPLGHVQLEVADGLRAVGIDLGQALEGDPGHVRLRGRNLQPFSIGPVTMEADAARWKPAGRRWRHALESRRVLAPLLIAPAVVFMALVVGVPFVWAIYLSFTDAIGGSLSGNWVGFDNFTDAWQDDNFRRALRNTLVFTLASQAIVLLGAAVLSAFLVRDFRGKWIVRFLVVLPWAAPVVLSTINWLWLLDSLYSVVNWTLARLHLDNALVWLLDAVHLEEDAQVPLQWLGRPESRAHRDHARARMANPSVRSRDLHRWPRVHPERGRGRFEDRRRDRGEEALVRRSPAAAPDRARRRALRDRLHRGRLRRRLHPHPRRPVQLDAGAPDVGVLRSGSTPARSARALRSRCSSSRCSCSSRS